jgi:hypothetical protein
VSLSKADFNGCVNLASVGAYAFNGCVSLGKPDFTGCVNLTDIGEGAF